VKSHLVIVGLGEVIPYKYFSCIKEAIIRGDIDSYSVIDLVGQRAQVNQRIQVADAKPENVFYLTNKAQPDAFADPEEFKPILEKLLNDKGKLKVLISPEVKAHEAYLKFCVKHGIDSLVEKPIIAPMKDGHFDPSVIESIMKDIIEDIKNNPAHHSVMTLGRYHRVYNDEILNPLKQKMITLGAPITSFHLRTASGVWNLYREYESREDHPYKYGYGMLMHGAYHYIDLFAQFLKLNKLIYPTDSFSLTLSSFVAYPHDQQVRIPKTFNENFNDKVPEWAIESIDSLNYGETDITTTFCLKNRVTGKVLTVGTISLEQTTPSVRSWRDIPLGFYNKNGRVSCTDIEAQLSTLYSIHGRAFKVPKGNPGNITRIDNYAEVQTRSNASLLLDSEYNTEKIFNNYFNSDSNRQLLTLWLQDKEDRSNLIDHFPAMQITQAIALSIRNPGQAIAVDLFDDI